MKIPFLCLLFVLFLEWSSQPQLLQAEPGQRELKVQQELVVEKLFPRIEQITFYSQTLKQKKTFCTVFPEVPLLEGQKGSVLFLLHGRGRHERSLLDDDQCRAALLKSKVVVILPDGDDGWYINSPVIKQDRYETYLEEVIALAEKHYPLSRDKNRRGLCGWSMGGYGAMHYAQNHSEEFRAVSTIIGLLDFPRQGLPEGQRYAVPTDRFGEDTIQWPQWNVLNQTEKIRPMSLQILTGTTAFDRTMNQNFSAELTRRHIPHEFRMLQGGHTFPVVRAALPYVVRFMNQKLLPEQSN